jgi:hypothetical protein
MMPIAPAVSSGIRGSDASAPTISTGDARLSHTLSGVTAGHCVIVVTNAFRFSTTTDLVTGVTIGGTAATLAVRIGASSPSTGHRTETCIWFVANQPAGSRAVVVSVNGPLFVNWHADAWPLATTTPLDRTASAVHMNPGTQSVPVPATGTTAALAQAAELVIASAGSKYNWTWGGTLGGGGTPPAGYALLAGITDDNVNQMPFQTVYRETTSTAGVSAGFSVAATDAETVGALATFRLASAQRRIRVLAESAINGATGITAYAWTGEPDGSLATRWTGLSAEGTGGVLFLPSPPASWPTGSDVNVIAYQPAGTQRGTSWVLGRVEEF